MMKLIRILACHRIGKESYIEYKVTMPSRDYLSFWIPVYSNKRISGKSMELRLIASNKLSFLPVPEKGKLNSSSVLGIDSELLKQKIKEADSIKDRILNFLDEP